MGDATQANLGVCCGWDVMGLNACEFFEDRARRVSEAGAALPHLQALPQHEGKKAYDDVGLDAVLALMPDWTDVELIFLDAKSGFGLRQLDVGFPELPIAPVIDVRSQEIGAFRERSLVVERSIVIDVEAKPRRTGMGLQCDCEARSSTLVLLQDATNLPVHRC